MEEQQKEELEETVRTEEDEMMEPEEQPTDNSAWKNKARPAIYAMAGYKNTKDRK